MEFKDRKVQYPGRIRLNLVSGNLYDLERAEGEIEEAGTPLNAATMNQIVTRLDEINTRLSVLEMGIPNEEDFSPNGYGLSYVSIGGATGDWVGYNTDTKQFVEGNATDSKNQIRNLYTGHTFEVSENYGRKVITYIKAVTGKLFLSTTYPPAGFTEKQISWVRVEYLPSHCDGTVLYIE